MLSRVGAAVAAVALGAVPAAPGTPDVWVEIEPDLRCPSPSAVEGALEERLGRESVHRGVAPEGGLELRIQAHGSRGAALRLSKRGDVLVERTIDVAASECAGLARTLALVVETWLPGDAAAVMPSTTSDGASSADAASSAVEPATVAPSASPPGAPPAGAAAPPRPDRAARPAAPPTTRKPPRVSALRRRTEGPRVEAALGAALPLDTGGNPAALLRVGAEVALGRLLCGLRGHFETEANLGLAAGLTPLEQAGRVSTRHDTVDVAAGWSPYLSETAEIAVLLSFGLDAVSAQTSGYTTVVDESFVAFVTGAGARAAWFVFRDVALSVAADATYESARQAFVAEGGTVIAYTPRFRARFTGGVLWSLF